MRPSSKRCDVEVDCVLLADVGVWVWESEAVDASAILLLSGR